MRKLTLITICLLVAAPAFADMGFNGVGVGGGIVMPESPWDMGFNGAAYVNLGEVSDGLVLVPGLSYWSAGYTEDLLGTPIDLTMTNIAINADVHYFFSGKEEGVYAGGGLSYNMLNFEIGFVNPFTGNTETIDGDDSKIGFQALGGYLMDVGSMKGFVEAKYNLISDFNTLQINVGVWFGGN